MTSMNTYAYIKLIICCLCLLSINVIYADNRFSIAFFASNNTKEIDLRTAYMRLTGVEQSDLQNSMIKIMQKNHIEQGKFEDILGTYRMSSDNNMTADNTEHFNTSPYQSLSDDKIFSLAKELAVTLKQDSVAVLIPHQSVVGGISLRFTSRQPKINEVLTMLHDRLPDSYSQAFSLHLANENGNFNSAKVSEVEWLGSQINCDELKKAFSLEQIHVHYGKAYLVYQNGQKKQLS